MNKNVLVVLIALVVCGAVLVIGLTLNRSGGVPGEIVAMGDGVIIQSAALPNVSTAPQSGEEPLYLLITVDASTYEPIPLTEGREYTITQKNSDAVNTVRVTKDGVVMASASCLNQDCVLQGEVTRENRQSRLLGNRIICLPNKVTLQLCTADELSQTIQIN
ncbi:MAG: NusG domain II-containing protein [Eubacteriales bacterium]|nr:NusG domain II-containing protein [Eubacteriales bacterium]